MSALNDYKATLYQIGRAKKCQAHLTASGRNGDRCQNHSIGANPTLCLQYTTGGQNYWECKDETSEMFLKHLNNSIAKSLGRHIDEALLAKEAEAMKYKEAAKAEYLGLFGEELPPKKSEAA